MGRCGTSTRPRHIRKAYHWVNGDSNGIIQEYIDLLEEMDFDLPRKNHSLKNFIYLRALVEVIPEVENKVNHRLETLTNSPQRR